MTQQKQAVPAAQEIQGSQGQGLGQRVRQSAQAARTAWAEAWQRGVEELQPVWPSRCWAGCGRTHRLVSLAGW